MEGQSDTIPAHVEETVLVRRRIGIRDHESLGAVVDGQHTLPALAHNGHHTILVQEEDSGVAAPSQQCNSLAAPGGRAEGRHIHAFYALELRRSDHAYAGNSRAATLIFAPFHIDP